MIKKRDLSELRGELNLRISNLELRIQVLEYNQSIAGEFYCNFYNVYGGNNWRWVKFNKSNIMDEVNGYVKINVIKCIFDVFGVRGKIKQKSNVVSTLESTFWMNKKYIVWHNKDAYACERKKIEKDKKIKEASEIKNKSK